MWEMVTILPIKMGIQQSRSGLGSTELAIQNAAVVLETSVRGGPPQYIFSVFPQKRLDLTIKCGIVPGLTLPYLTLHYITLHITLHYTLHYIALHYIT